MTFLLFILDVTLTWLALFFAAYVCSRILTGTLLVSSLAVVGWANMYVHQLIGTSINAPFWSAALFAMALHNNSFLIEVHGERITKYGFWAS